MFDKRVTQNRVLHSGSRWQHLSGDLVFIFKLIFGVHFIWLKNSSFLFEEKNWIFLFFMSPQCLIIHFGTYPENTCRLIKKFDQKKKEKRLILLDFSLMVKA